MSEHNDYVQKFINSHKEYFSRNKVFIEENKWNESKGYKKNLDDLTKELVTLSKVYQGEELEKQTRDITYKIRQLGESHQKNKAAEFKQETELTSSIVGRLSAFIKDTEKIGDRKLERAQKFIDYTVDIIKLHLKKCDDYLNYSMKEMGKEVKTEEQIEYRGQEIKFQDLVFQKKIAIQDTLDSLNIENSIEEVTVKLHGDDKAPLIMREPLCLKSTDIRLKTERIPVDWNISTSKEMFKNMNPRDIPQWNESKHFFDQDPIVLAFWAEELNKVKNGLNIGGYYIGGWLYFHLNFFRTPIPQADGTEPNSLPDLRDNEWFFAENLKKCVSLDYPDYYSKAMLIYGTRRFGKSVILASLAHWRTITKFNSSGTIIGGTSSDLNALTSKVKTSMSFIDTPLRMDVIKQEWESGETTFGVKMDASTPVIFSSLIVQNLELASSKKTQKTAGLAPSVSIYDEIGKYPFLKPYLAALPSFKTPYGFKCVTVLAGCVCAGTKVWTNSGSLVNIEDLNQEDGIIGYDSNKKQISKEHITYWQKPHKKVCYRIETNQGRTLECSEDHPILKRDEWDCGIYKKTQSFSETKDLRIGDSIAVIEEVDIWGTKKMKEPRLIGWLVGDGSYGQGQSTRLMNADPEMNRYIHENYKTNVYFEAPTKDGRVLQKTNITGLVPQLKELGIYGQTRDNKRLPDNIHSYRKEDVCEFIGGYFDADGCAYTNDTTKETFLKITSANEEILKELKLLLQKLGIHGNLMFEKMGNSPKSTRGHFNLIIKDKKSIIKFRKEIKFSIKYKQERLERGIGNIEFKRCKSVKTEPAIRFEKITKIENIGIQNVYNLTADNTHTYIANGIVTHNTGGEAELSRDAMDVLGNPTAFDLLPMDWDLLENHIDPEFITWKRSNFATFFPGQMAYEEGFIKEKKKLGDYIGKPDDELNKIDIHVTNWQANGKYLEDKAEEAKNAKSAKASLLAQQRKVQYPLDPKHCFLSSDKNQFPHEEALEHKNYLYETGKWDRRRSLFRDSSGKIRSEISDKPLAEYPHQGGNVDAPFLIFEDIPDYKPEMYVYVAGGDFYKQENSQTDSVGTIYIFKFPLFADDFAYKLVASYSARPNKLPEFYDNCLLLLEAYNAIMLPENEDLSGFQTYLEKKHLEEKYLMPNIDFSSTLEYVKNATRKWGWTPANSKQKLINMFVNYCNESVIIKNDAGEAVEVKRVQTIDDVWLLEEIINFKPDINSDRIISCLGAIGALHYLDKNYIYPKVKRRYEQDSEKPEKKVEHKRSFYSNPKRRRRFY